MTCTVLLCFGLIPIFMVVQIYMLGRRMSEPEKMIRPLPGGGVTNSQHSIISRYNGWLAQQGLEFRSAFQFGKIKVVVFQQADQPRFFSFYFHQRVAFAAESYLPDLTVLDSGSSGSAGLFPRPGAYGQSFPNASAQDLWQKHLQAEAHLTQKFGFQWVPLCRPYDDILKDAMRIRMQHNRSLSFWPIRVMYRYFVTRHALLNRTIAQQYP